MSIIQKIFARKKAEEDGLLAYGFKRVADGYEYSVMICGQMRLRVTVKDGQVFTEVYDTETEEPYTLFLVEDAAGEFVGRVRAEYTLVLEDIAKKCFVTQIFGCVNTAAVIGYARKRYGDEPEFLWEDTPDCAILRRGDTKKWYAVIMTVAYRKIGLDRDGTTEALNVRVDPDELDRIVDNATYFRGWHMNKKRWTTMLLDGSAPLEEILGRLDYSYTAAVK